MKTAAIFLTLSLLAQSALSAQDSWVGRKVMPKSGAVYKNGTEIFPTRDVVLPITVMQDKKGWLYFGKAWIQKEKAVLLEDAPAYYNQYLRNNPSSSWCYVNRGVIWQIRGELDNAIKDYSEAIRIDPDSAHAYYNRAAAWNEKGELDNVIKDFTEAIRIDPTDASAYGNRGVTWGKKGELDNAIKDCTEAIRLDPNNAKAFNNRGALWSRKDELENAIKDHTEAIRLAPKYVSAYYNRGVARKHKGELNNAIKDYTEAIRINSKFAWPHNGLAWLYATSPNDDYRDGKLAVEFATKACELTGWTNEEFIDTLACAHAEAGNFEKAMKWQTKSIEQQTGQDTAGLERRLELFKQNKPYRED